MPSVRICITAALGIAVAGTGHAQQLVTRSAAISSAVERGPRNVSARADSAIAWAGLIRARQYDNPILSLEYTKDAPRYHVALEMPLDALWLRTPRTHVALATADAVAARVVRERQMIAYEADTAFTQAVAAAARARLSLNTARDADSLLALARIRRDAGDGSALDVELAALNAGQAHTAAAADSLEAIVTTLAVRNIMGLDSRTTIIIGDTLVPATFAPAGASGVPLPIAAAAADLRAAEMSISLERRQRFGLPSVTAGFERHDPGGSGDQVLPTLGVSVPLPLLNRNRGARLLAEATRDRARAQLALVTLEYDLALARARMSFTVAQERATRTQALVDRANRVAALSLLGFREGATPIGNVLEAQRLVRENLTQYVNDAAAALNAASLLQLLGRTGPVNAHR